MLSEWSMGDSFAIRSTEFLPGSLFRIHGFLSSNCDFALDNQRFLHDKISSLDTCQNDSI